MDLEFQAFPVCPADLSVQLDILYQEPLGVLETLSDLEVHQNLADPVSPGRLHYMEWSHLFAPSCHRSLSCLGARALLVGLSLLGGLEIPVLEAPRVLLSLEGLAVREALSHQGLHPYGPLEARDPLFLQHVHPDHLVHAAPEILGAHPVLFLLFALSLLI